MDKLADKQPAQELVFEASLNPFGAEAKFNAETGVFESAMVFSPATKVGDHYESDNGVLYSKAYFESLAKAINSGKGVPGWDGHPEKNADGTRKDRKVGHAIAKTKNARVTMENGRPAVRADFCLLKGKKEQYADTLMECADNFGLSIGAASVKNFDASLGRPVFEGVAELVCVDLVDRPSATRNFYESTQDQPEKKEATMPAETAVTPEQFTKLQETVMESQKKLALAERKALVAEKLAAAKLEGEFVTESLRASLMSAEADKLDGIITEHKQLIAKTQNPVKGNGAAKETVMESKDNDKIDVVVGAARGLGTIWESFSGGKTDRESVSKAKAQWNDKILPFLWDARMPQHKQGKFNWENAERVAFFEALNNEHAPTMFARVTGMNPRPGMFDGMNYEAAIATSSYTTILTGGLSSKMIEAYNVVDGLIADQLVTVYPSKLLAEKWPGFDAAAGIAAVNEGAKYPDATIAEKYAGNTLFSKRGVMVQVTEETILFDQTGQLLMRANQIGNSLRVDREKIMLDGIENSIAAYYPAGSVTAIYDANNTVFNNPLTAIDSLDAADAKLVSQVDSNGDYMTQPGSSMLILVPQALRLTAEKLVGLSEIRQTDGAGNVLVGRNPYQSLRVVNTGYLNDTTTWFYGSLEGFRRQFVLQSHMPFRVATVDQAEVDATTKDIVGGVVARWKERVFALDNKFVVKNTVAAS